MGCEGTCDCSCTKVVVDPLGSNVTVSCGPGGLTVEGCRCDLSGSTGGTSVAMWAADEGILFITVNHGGTEYHGICEGTVCNSRTQFDCGGNVSCLDVDGNSLTVEIVGDECTFEIYRADGDALLGYIDAASLPAGAGTGNGLILTLGGVWYGAYLGNVVAVVPTVATDCVLDMTATVDDLDPTVLSTTFLDTPDPSCPWEGLHHLIVGTGVCQTAAALQGGFCDTCPGSPMPGTVRNLILSTAAFEASCEMQVWIRQGLYSNNRGVRWYPGAGNRNFYFRGVNTSPDSWNLEVRHADTLVWSEPWVQDSVFHTIRVVRDASAMYWYYDGILKYTDTASSTGVALGNADCSWSVGAFGRYNCSRLYLRNFQWTSGQWYY